MWWHDRAAIVALAGFAVLCVAQARHRRGRARAAAERWLAEHGYRPRADAATPWLANPRFPVRFGRDSDDAVDLRFVVDDRRLGGTGVLWLRLWTDWRGVIGEEPDVWWERMPDPAAAEAPPAGAPWEAAQLALLARIAGGETRFRPDDGHTAEAGARFDEVVEHLLAMQRRGLITCATPLAELQRPGRLYALVTDVALTAEGRHLADRNAGS